MLKKILLLLLITSFYFLVPNSAHAQTTTTPLNITVSPPVFDLVANPGDTINETFRIRNNESKAIPFKIEARRLVSDPTTGNPTPANDTKGEELSWVKFNPESFSALPREWTDVKFTISIPETAAFGYYYVFRLVPQNGQQQKSTGTAIQGEVLIVTLLNVKKDNAKSSAKLDTFKTGNFVSQYLPVNFSVVLENEGNVHVKPHGNIFISRNGKDEIATLNINEANGSILPGGKRTFTTMWNDGFIVNTLIKDENGTIKTDKNGKPQSKLTINWNKLTSLRIGPYTAHLLMVYDDGKRDQTIEAETKFWVIPYAAIGIFVVGIIVVLLILKWILSSYIRGQVKKSGGK